MDVACEERYIYLESIQLILSILLQVTIHIIDLLNPQRTEKRPIAADAALMNPVARILALRYAIKL
jgi:hypothetical protein